MTQTREQVEAQLRELLEGFATDLDDYESTEVAEEAFTETLGDLGFEVTCAYMDQLDGFVVIDHPDHGEVVVGLSPDAYDMYYGEGDYRDPVRIARDQRSDHITGQCGPDCPYIHDEDSNFPQD